SWEMGARGGEGGEETASDLPPVLLRTGPLRDEGELRQLEIPESDRGPEESRQLRMGCGYGSPPVLSSLSGRWRDRDGRIQPLLAGMINSEFYSKLLDLLLPNIKC